MYNYTIVRISSAGACLLCFCAGTCLGGLSGITVGILDHSMNGILSGIFFGLLFGIFSGLVGLIYAAVFNLLSPTLGGLAVKIEAPDKPSAAITATTDSK